MKAQHPSTSLQDNRGELFEALRGLDPRLRSAIGLTCCAVIAYYIPSILIALTGVWVNNLTMMLQLLAAVLILVVQNIIGNKLHKPFLISVAFAMILDGYEVYSFAGTSPWSALRFNWMVFFLPTVAFLLNAWLFLRFKAAADLK